MRNESRELPRESNYELFKRGALQLFQNYDPAALIRRLSLSSDEDFLYIDLLGRSYRFSLKMPLLEYRSGEDFWAEADSNETLSLCDLLCHTTDPLVIHGDFTTLESLNRVQGGTTQTTLGGNFFQRSAVFFAGKEAALEAACRSLGGFPAGKGDVAYEIPLFGPVHIRFSYYEADEEFPAALNLLFPADICRFLHYETLYYISHLLLGRLKELMTAI